MITVLGAGGFIGSHVVSTLQRAGTPHQAPARGEPLAGRDLGHVIYCVGLTADFRERPHDTVDAHVTALLALVRDCAFESLLYLSSTRVYANRPGVGPASESDELWVNPLRSDDLYNLSKLTGESIVLGLTGGRGRVARLSNVYGPGQSDTFLAQVLDEATRRGTVTLRTGLDCARDYVSVHDVAPLLVRIAQAGKERVYNVASGAPVSTRALVAAIGCTVTVEPGAPDGIAQDVDTQRIRAEFGFEPASILDDLPTLLGALA